MATRPVRSGVISLHEHDGFGGSFYDTRHLSNFYNYDQPHHFGMMVANIFTSADRFTEKILTGLTLARGNYVGIDDDIYRWCLSGDDTRLFRVSDFVETGNNRPGFNNQEFRIVLDKPWMHEPDIIMGEDNRLLLEIVGHPQQIGEGRYMYTVRMQSSDPTFYMPVDQIQVGRTFRKSSTSVGTELNQLYGTGQWGSQIELQSQIGAYAEKVEVTDKIVRKEIAARKKGKSASKEGYNAMNGMVAPFKIITKKGKEINAGTFITYAEMDVFERLNSGREEMMTFGHVSERPDYHGSYIKRTGPGYRQLVLDGHIYYHNGSLSAQELEDFFMQIFYYRKGIRERNVVIDTGTLGARFFDQLLSDEASAFLTLDTLYIRKAPAEATDGIGNHQLEYGAEFVSFTAKNGVKVRRVYNPMKDDPDICRRFHPDNPTYTVDSARMDIYDFAGQTDSVAPGQSNMSMIMENGVDEYFWVSDLIDPQRGVVNDGSRVSNPDKAISCRRATSGSLCVWDSSRIASIIYEPDLI